MSKRAKKLGQQFAAYVLGSYRAKRNLLDSYVQAGMTESDAQEMVENHHRYVFVIVTITSMILLVSAIYLEDVSLVPWAHGLGWIAFVVCFPLIVLVGFGQMMANLRTTK